jgi:hypothetical protein
MNTEKFLGRERVSLMFSVKVQSCSLFCYNGFTGWVWRLMVGVFEESRSKL